LKSATLRWLITLAKSGIAPPARLSADYPHVLDKLAAAWGSAPAMAELMEKDLLFDNRGDRQGFPIEVLAEIQALYDIHRARFTVGLPLPRGWDAVVLEGRRGSR
jgi:hypothetical protein